MDTDNTKMHQYYMRKCIELAIVAKNRGDNPVGSIVVKNNEIIGTGIEANKTQNDITKHAEIEAIRDACKNLGHHNLTDCLLYSTHEPCVMCSYSIRFSKIEHVIYSIKAAQLGGHTSDYSLLTDTDIKNLEKVPLITHGILLEECKEILG